MIRWSNILQLFYPRICLLCNDLLIDKERQLCLKCLCDLPRTHYHQRAVNPAMMLFAGYPFVEQVIPYLIFEMGGVAQRMIHEIKYHGNKQLAFELGQHAANEMITNQLTKTIELLLPVPLHPRKERRRGYNQSTWIAKGIAARCGLPIVDTLLKRTVHTASQTKRSTYERHLNVESSVYLQADDTIKGKHLLLIDDVITTGATLSACLEAIKSIPGVRVTIFSLAIVPLYPSTS